MKNLFFAVFLVTSTQAIGQSLEFTILRLEDYSDYTHYCQIHYQAVNNTNYTISALQFTVRFYDSNGSANGSGTIAAMELPPSKIYTDQVSIPYIPCKNIKTGKAFPLVLCKRSPQYTISKDDCRDLVTFSNKGVVKVDY